MELDLRTLFLILMAVESVLAIVLLLFWATQATLPGIAHITLATTMGAVAGLMTGFRGPIPIPLSILVSNFCFVIALLLIMRAFEAARGSGIRRLRFEIALVVLVMASLGYFTLVDFNTEARIPILATGLGIGAVIEGFSLIQERDADLKVPCRLVAGLFAVFAVAEFANAALTLRHGATTVYLDNRTTSGAVALLVSLGTSLGWTLGFLWLAYGISQNRLRKAEKLDAIGRLAGGIAHELNNILTPIVGLTDSVLQEMGATDRRRGRLEMVLRASNRAAELVRGILTFGQRQDAMVPEKIDIAAVVRDSLDILRADLPDSLTVTATLDATTGFVVADADYVRIVLGNLISNAVDAMEGIPGRLRISLSATAIAAKTNADALGLAPGTYARLTVADNGHGMNRATLSHAIDPFFTTKAVGNGVGLGLSMVNGIAAMAGGSLRLSSLPGLGTTAEVYLPLAGD